MVGEDLSELAVGDDGMLEVWISPDEHPGNWLPTVAAATQLLIRQYQVDWEQDRVATLHLERLDTGDAGAAPTEAAAAEALDKAAAWVDTSAPFWSDYMEGARADMADNSCAHPPPRRARADIADGGVGGARPGRGTGDHPRRPRAPTTGAGRCTIVTEWTPATSPTT